MKIRLAVSKEKYAEVENALSQCGIEIDDTAEFVLSENNRFIDNLLVKDSVSGNRVQLSVDEIVYIETFGHTVEVHTLTEKYLATDRLYQVCQMLDTEKFLRISNSVVVAKDMVRNIQPTLSMKFILTLAEGTKVDVTRSYYYIFKEAFGI